jgi:hypothetical protein
VANISNYEEEREGKLTFGSAFVGRPSQSKDEPAPQSCSGKGEHRGACGTSDVYDRGLLCPVVLGTAPEQVNVPVYACSSDVNVIHHVKLAICSVYHGAT